MPFLDHPQDLFKPLRVHFIGEEGIDAGGVKKEFFQLLVSELISGDYGMLQLLPETNTYWCVWPAVDAAAVLLCLCACTCVCADACMQLCFCVCEC